MNIIPSKEQFFDWSQASAWVPVLGEKRVPRLRPALLFKELFGTSREAFLFESGKGPESISRYSLMGIPNTSFVRIEEQASTFSRNGTTVPVKGSVQEGWDHLNFCCETLYFDHLPHFWGGWVGYIAYEAGTSFENLPWRRHNDLGLPDAWFMQVDRLLLYDHETKLLKYIIAVQSQDDATKYEYFVEEIKNFWKQIDAVLSSGNVFDEESVTAPVPNLPSNGLHSNLSPKEYMDRVRQAKVYISEGDVYQANIAQRFETGFDGDSLELYLRLRAINPSPFSGYLRFHDFTIVSSSPERLIRVQDRLLETRPIAGTRPRGDDPEKDRTLALELLLNEKERAEHLMLVDLERNDMGRVCEVGSVQVTSLMFLERYSHVSHIVSNIKGWLRSKTTVLELLKAVFPGGTITGCPKIRCMEIIRELEPSDRGPYSGSFGYIGFSRQMDLNIIIRTILVKDGKAWFHVGAGIVADSDPKQEYQETLDKAAAMTHVLTHSI
jgi:anthranilate synthase component 1/para-aminobenzoate synthetase component 1